MIFRFWILDNYCLPDFLSLFYFKRLLSSSAQMSKAIIILKTALIEVFFKTKNYFKLAKINSILQIFHLDDFQFQLIVFKELFSLIMNPIILILKIGKNSNMKTIINQSSQMFRSMIFKRQSFFFFFLGSKYTIIL